MRIQVHDVSLAYDERGSGIPLLFIHGYPLNRTLWEPQLEGLAGHARLIAPDLRGHGESEAIPGPYSMELLADDCAELLDRIGAEGPAVLCGLSMGGYVALAFARKYPQRLGGLILAATRAGADTAEGKVGRDRAAAQARSEGTAAVSAGMLPKMLAPASYERRPDLVQRVGEMMRTISLEGMVGDLQAMKDRPDSTPTLEKLEQPVLILHGAEDQLIPPSEAERMAAAQPQARLGLLPQAGHLPNLEQPERFNSAVQRFLQDNFSS